MWTEGSTEACPTSSSTAGHLLEQARPGKRNHILSLMSILCTYVSLGQQMFFRVEWSSTWRAGCCWRKQSPIKHAWKQRHVAKRLRVWKRLLSIKMGKGKEPEHTRFSQRSVRRQKYPVLEGKVCRLPGSVCQEAQGQCHAVKFSQNTGKQAESQGSSLTSTVAAWRKLPVLLFWKVIKSFLEKDSVSAVKQREIWPSNRSKDKQGLVTDLSAPGRVAEKIKSLTNSLLFSNSNQGESLSPETIQMEVQNSS